MGQRGSEDEDDAQARPRRERRKDGEGADKRHCQPVLHRHRDGGSGQRHVAGQAPAEAGAESAYQPVVVALGSGIVLRGQVYVPRRLLKPAAVARAERNAKEAEALKAAGPAAGQPRMADGSIG